MTGEEYFTKAVQLLNAKMMTEAIMHFDRAIEILPIQNKKLRTFSYYNRALAHIFSGKRELAIRDLEEAIKIDWDPEFSKQAKELLRNFQTAP